MERLKKVICEYFKRLKNNFNEDIVDVVMDSREIKKGSLFFAINNGNRYVQEALEKGASLVICDNSEIKDDRVIKVKDSLLTMQELATRYREELGLKIVAITGSEGKTTTKDLIYSVLKERYKCYKTLGNYNNQIGLPYSILQLKESDEIAVLEMGMSSLGEIDRLAQISKPNYAVITNIGDSHLEYLINRDNVFKAKTELLNYVNKENRVLYGDDVYLKNVEGKKVGFEEQNDYVITKMKEYYDKTEFNINDENYSISLNGVHNVINSSFAVAMGKMFGMDKEEIEKGLKDAKITGMRFEKIEKNGNIYINDAYNASPVSMKMALRTFNNLPTTKKKIVVLGDMLEMGEKEIEYHKEILKEVSNYDFDIVFVVGERMKKALKEIKSDKIKCCEKEEIRSYLDFQKDLIILLKASRGIKLEEII